MLKKLVVVYNPRSSQHKALDAEVLAPARKLSGWLVGKYEIRPTNAQDNAEKLAVTLSDGDLVIVAGGDGTAAVAVNGIMLSGKDVTLGVLGYGNFNDVARMLGSKQPVKYGDEYIGGVSEIVERFEAGKVEEIYPLEAVVDGKHWRYAPCYITLGMFAESTEVFDKNKVRKHLSKKGSHKLYSLGCLALWYFRSRKRDFLPEMELEQKSYTKKRRKGVDGARVCVEENSEGVDKRGKSVMEVNDKKVMQAEEVGLTEKGTEIDSRELPKKKDEKSVRQDGVRIWRNVNSEVWPVTRGENVVQENANDKGWSVQEEKEDVNRVAQVGFGGKKENRDSLQNSSEPEKVVQGRCRRKRARLSQKCVFSRGVEVKLGGKFESDLSVSQKSGDEVGSFSGMSGRSEGENVQEKRDVRDNVVKKTEIDDEAKTVVRKTETEGDSRDVVEKTETGNRKRQSFRRLWDANRTKFEKTQGSAWQKMARMRDDLEKRSEARKSLREERARARREWEEVNRPVIIMPKTVEREEVQAKNNREESIEKATMDCEGPVVTEVSAEEKKQKNEKNKPSHIGCEVENVMSHNLAKTEAGVVARRVSKTRFLVEKNVTDYLAVNTVRVAGMMRGRKYYRKSDRFLSSTARLGKFGRLVWFMMKSVVWQLPGKKVKEDIIRFSEASNVTIHAEGEHQRLNGVREIRVRKAKRGIKVVRF